MTAVPPTRLAREADVNDAAEAEGMPVLACGLLRDTAGQVLLVHIGHDPGGVPMWWLPGAHVPPARSATETLRAFLTADLGIHRPRIRGQHLISCDPSPAEPAGQLLILFDCATIDPRQLDRRRLRPDAFVHDACWASIEHAPGRAAAGRIPRPDSRARPPARRALPASPLRPARPSSSTAARRPIARQPVAGEHDGAAGNVSPHAGGSRPPHTAASPAPPATRGPRPGHAARRTASPYSARPRPRARRHTLGQGTR